MPSQSHVERARKDLRKLAAALIAALLLFVATFAGCAPMAKQPVAVRPTAAAVVVEKQAEAEKAAEATAAPAAAMDDKDNAAPQVDAALLPKPNRLIIKNGEMQLEVDDVDVAINRATQIVTDLDGYVISSNSSFNQRDGQDYKTATLTLGVPSQDFETALRRLREMSRRVLKESSSGQDVTDEYVDQKSRLENLQATRDRIRGFLDQAKTVEEALKINDQLKQVEDEIEQVQGRMNYLFDRAAYSTITITLEPYIPPVTPTPTVVPTDIPTPTPTPWAPGETFTEASTNLGNLLRGLVNVAIYGGVLCLPFLIPLGLLVWAGVALRKRFPRRRKAAVPPAEPPAQT